jgi:hypothetical protein
LPAESPEAYSGSSSHLLDSDYLHPAKITISRMRYSRSIQRVQQRLKLTVDLIVDWAIAIWGLLGDRISIRRFADDYPRQAQNRNCEKCTCFCPV